MNIENLESCEFFRSALADVERCAMEISVWYKVRVCIDVSISWKSVSGARCLNPE
jgi:hypothetical protein